MLKQIIFNKNRLKLSFKNISSDKNHRGDGQYLLVYSKLPLNEYLLPWL